LIEYREIEHHELPGILLLLNGQHPALAGSALAKTFISRSGLGLGAPGTAWVG
jgi:hypothetical protein